MSENAISISNLNDFIFCPVSIYFHSLDIETEKMTYQCSDQLNGAAAHERVDAAAYTTDSSVLQGIAVYSDRYDLFGKIDTFHIKSGVLRERKKKIKVIYDGYIFQLYAQCVALREMGYTVNKLILYSRDDNRSYEVPLPEDASATLEKFEQLIAKMRAFSMDSFVQENAAKCHRCIYEPLCSFSKAKEDAC